MFKLCEKITFFCFVYIFAFFRNNYSAFLDPPPLPPLQEQIGALKRGWDLTRVSKPSLVHSNILNPPLRIIAHPYVRDTEFSICYAVFESRLHVPHVCILISTSPY